jgi:3-oxoacyl-[acyl-carrier-protein] synthase II
MNIALAALAVERRTLFPPCDPSERPASGAVTQAVVTGVGHWRGEGLALVEAVECAVQKSGLSAVGTLASLSE